MIQTRRETLVLWSWGFGVWLATTPEKSTLLRRLKRIILVDVKKTTKMGKGL
jgi:hypothetical protein